MYIENEWCKLRKVILGSAKKYLNYDKSEKQNKIEKGVLKEIQHIMEKKNIEVIQPKYMKDLDIKESLWVRDSSIVIDNQFILMQLQDDCDKRKLEYKTVDLYKNITQKNEKIKIEGGDIIQMNNVIFIGVHKRTNILGYRWLKQLLPNKRIIKINHTALHLDCCFSILPNKMILYSKKYIKKLPYFCYKNFRCLNIDNIILGDTNLSRNFLFLDKNTILVDNQYRFKNVRKLLKKLGFEIIIINLKNMWKYGGSIRCLTQPLIRDSDEN